MRGLKEVLVGTVLVLLCLGIGEWIHPYSILSAAFNRVQVSLPPAKNEGNWTRPHSTIQVEKVAVTLDFLSLDKTWLNDYVTVSGRGHIEPGHTYKDVFLLTNYTETEYHTRYPDGLVAFGTSLAYHSLNDTASVGPLDYSIFGKGFTVPLMIEKGREIEPWQDAQGKRIPGVVMEIIIPVHEVRKDTVLKDKAVFDGWYRRTDNFTLPKVTNDSGHAVVHQIQGMKMNVTADMPISVAVFASSEYKNFAANHVGSPIFYQHGTSILACTTFSYTLLSGETETFCRPHPRGVWPDLMLEAPETYVLLTSNESPNKAFVTFEYHIIMVEWWFE